MQYRKATPTDTDQIFHLVQHTITTIYPRYYPKEVVDFFCAHHSREKIVQDIEKERVNVLRVENHVVGTGSREDNHITRVFVDPDFQGKGYGSYIMQQLEDELTPAYDTVFLDASLPASQMYEHRGYRMVKHEKWPVENGAVLVYEVMEKKL